METTQDLVELCIEGGNDGESGLQDLLFTWPKLSSLELLEVRTDVDNITTFLSANQATISSIYFHIVQLSTGTWSTPLGIMRDMPRLSCLRLYTLRERTLRDTAPPALLEEFIKKGGREITGGCSIDWQLFQISCGRAHDVNLALNVLLSDSRTLRDPHWELSGYPPTG